MVENDKKILFKLKGLYSQYNELSISIRFSYLIQLITCLLTLVTSITVIKFFNSKNELYIGMILFYFMWILNFHYIYLLYEAIEFKKNRRIKLNNDIENLKDFNAYVIAYRHLESLKDGHNIYPDLRENDSRYVYEHYKEKFEKKRIKFEKDHIIEL